MNTTVKECWNYFKLCKDYWLRSGDNETSAINKAYWYDCWETWNYDRSWNDAKEEFAKEFILMYPNSKYPEED